MSDQVFKPYREESRRPWGATVRVGESVTREQIQLGALLRIADATEKMAQRHTELIADRDYYERRCRDLQAEVARLGYVVRGLRSANTRLKKRRDGA